MCVESQSVVGWLVGVCVCVVEWEWVGCASAGWCCVLLGDDDVGGTRRYNVCTVCTLAVGGGGRWVVVGVYTFSPPACCSPC